MPRKSKETLMFQKIPVKKPLGNSKKDHTTARRSALRTKLYMQNRVFADYNNTNTTNTGE